MFGSIGFATETHVPREVNAAASGTDPVAKVKGPALTLAGGATLHVTPALQLTARIGDAIGHLTDAAIARCLGGSAASLPSVP